jgi:hypothetical protein
MMLYADVGFSLVGSVTGSQNHGIGISMVIPVYVVMSVDVLLLPLMSVGFAPIQRSKKQKLTSKNRF